MHHPVASRVYALIAVRACLWRTPRQCAAPRCFLPACLLAAAPLVATCGSACARIGGSNGQNFHSVAYKELAGGRHMVFVSAQVDNNVGAVEIISPEIIALLKPPSSHY